jgi:isopentenyl-diphosphate delta-isomerase
MTVNASSYKDPAAADILILVDEDDQQVGAGAKYDCHTGTGKLHRAFSVFLFDQNGRLLIQQRSNNKMLWGGYWANSCCSHPRLGEDTHDAATRRVKEELGVNTELTFLYKFVYHAQFGTVGAEYENCWVYAGTFDGVVDVDPDEIAAWRFVTPNELTTEIEAHNEKFAPWFKLEWEQIRREFLDRIV